MMSSSNTAKHQPWYAGCSYLLTPGAKLAFGKQQCNDSNACETMQLVMIGLQQRWKLTQNAGNKSEQYVVNFEEASGPDPLGDMLMKVSCLVAQDSFAFMPCSI